MALRCGLFTFCLCGGAWRSAVGSRLLVPQLLQFHHGRCSCRQYDPDSTSVSDRESISHASSTRKTSGRDFLHCCRQSDSRPSFTNVAVKVSGSKICRVRDSKGFRDFDFAVFCELLHPQCCSSNVLNQSSGSSPYCHASSRRTRQI